MSRAVVNLARRAFINSRPVRRTAALLWVLAALVLAADLWLYRSYFVGSSEKARRLAEIEEAITRERQRSDQLEVALAGMNLAQQNQAVAFLNLKIAERSFAWSRLFDDLAELLPQEVRLQRLDPEVGEAQRRRGTAPAAAAADGDRRAVTLLLTGEARSDEALLELVDNLFEHPAFRNPNPHRETRGDGDLLYFDLTVEYLLDAGGEAAAPPEAAAVDELPPATAGQDEADAGEEGAGEGEDGRQPTAAGGET